MIGQRIRYDQHMWSWLSRWWRYNWRRMAGAVLFLAGLGITIWLASRGSGKTPASSGESTAYVVLAAFFQLAAAYFFAESGKPDGTHVGAAVLRLWRLANRVGRLSLDARDSAEHDTAAEVKRKMEVLAAELAYLTEDTVDSMSDWEAFSPDAQRKIKEIQKGTEE